MTHSRGTIGYSIDPRKGEYAESSSGEPRIHGSQQGLFKATEETELMPHSAEIDSSLTWSQSSGITSSTGDSVVQGGTRLFAGGGAGGFVSNQPDSNFSDGVEIVIGVFRPNSSNNTSFEVRRDNNELIASVNFDPNQVYNETGKTIKQSDPGQATFNSATGINSAFIHKLGGDVFAENAFMVEMRFEASGISSSDNVQPEIKVKPDTQSDDYVQIHYVGYRHSESVTQLIPTGSTKETHDEDLYTVDVDGWWNPNGGSFIVDVQPTAYNFCNLLSELQGGAGARWLIAAQSSGVWQVRDQSGNTASVDLDYTRTEPTRVAVSFDPGKFAVQTANDVATQDNTDGTLAANPGEFFLGGDGGGDGAIYYSVRYIPKYLTQQEREVLVG
jgi:hypothetical protein